MFTTGKKKTKKELPSRRSTGHSSPQRPSNEELASRYAFRRNRTITGSSSAKITSSNELHAELRSPRAHVHHLTSLRRTLLGYFGVVSILSLGLYLLLAQLVAAQTMQLSGLNVLTDGDTSAYQASVNSYYAARPAERLRFLLNTEELLAHIQSSRSEVQSIRVEPGAELGEAVITVTARQPIAHWNINGDDQFVDEEGVVFMRNYFASPKLQIVDESGLQATNNKLVASNRFLGFVGRTIARSKSIGLQVNKVTIPALTTRQVTINLEGKQTYYKLSIDRSAGQQVEDIARLDRYFSTAGFSAEYADVRLAGKAYYK